MSVEFTVGIPTHNRRETVLLALASALEQTRPPVRVYVVADGCTDGTQEAVHALGECSEVRLKEQFVRLWLCASQRGA